MKPFALLLLTLILGLAACQPAPISAPVPESPTSSEETTIPAPDSATGSDEMPTAPVENRYAPQPGDQKLISGNVYINEKELLTLESIPLQFLLSISGDLPDPCHQLRVSISPPDSENKIYVEAYTLTDPETMCMQVLKPFDASIPLGSFPAGEYQLFLNGEKIADFQA